MKKIILSVVCIFLTINNANAQLFNIEATRVSNSQVVRYSFNSAEEAIDFFKNGNLNSAFGANVSGEEIDVDMNYRGLPATLDYDTSGNLTLNIPGIVNNKVFAGGSQDASAELLKDFLKSDGAGLLNQINKRLAAVSPVDPIAGNPTSLMSQMVDDDFELTFVDSLHDNNNNDSAGKKIGNEMGFGASYSQYNVSGIDTSVVSLTPFSYRKNFGQSDVKLLFKFPVLKMIDTEGAKTYQASGAIGLNIPLYKNIWSITPLASVGVVGSEDLVSGALMRGISATNKLKYETEGGWGFAFGTLLGSYKTERAKVEDIEFDPGIDNKVLKNSFSLSVPTGSPGYKVDLSVANTKFYGTELYIDNYMDYGIGLVKTNYSSNNEARLDLKYFSYNR